MEIPVDQYNLEVVSLRVVNEKSLYSGSLIQSPKDALKLMGEYLCSMDREIFMILNLSTKGKPINCNICTVGTLNSSLVHPREVFKSAILSNANSVIIMHNHPSGDTTPSKEDKEVAKQLIRAGKLLGIPVIDSVIVGDKPDIFLSMNEEGYIVNGKFIDEPKRVWEKGTYNADKGISIRNLINEFKNSNHDIPSSKVEKPYSL